MMVDWGVVARAIHVLAVVVWIGGIWFVTAVVLPGMAEKPPEEWLGEFDTIERRFAPQARIAVLLVLLSGIYMLYHYADRVRTRSLAVRTPFRHANSAMQGSPSHAVGPIG
jgi:uncharacterized membrane protein